MLISSEWRRTTFCFYVHLLTVVFVMHRPNHTDLAAAQRVGSLWVFVLIEMMHKYNRDVRKIVNIIT